MIHYAIAFDPNKNVGVAYNATMRLLGEDDWCCFVDGDSMFLNPYFGRQIEEYVNRHPECGIFTCKTNRVAAEYMLVGNWKSDDVVYHKRLAQELSTDLSVTDITGFARDFPLSGVLMLISRKAWTEVGGFKETGMLGVDNDMHRRMRDHGFKVYMMNGVYVYHWYRGGNRQDTSHLL